MASQSFQNFRAGLPPPAECLAILVGCMEVTIFGLGGFANPLEFSRGFGVPMLPAGSTTSTASDGKSSGDDQVQKTQQAYITAIAARNLQNGILLLTLGCYYYGVKEAIWGHVFGIVNSAAIGGSLLYWSRTDKLW
ncbi:hypothetical protein LTR86_004812 [Recurvomyces mirabilis]|nr:hypothetical protein LTR86_004812 [Recurvomyces mirabilis]